MDGLKIHNDLVDCFMVFGLTCVRLFPGCSTNLNRLVLL